MKIIKIHGCSGAGKTTVVRKFMEKYGADPIPGGAMKIEGYTVNLYPTYPTYVLGSYENVCGGMDTVNSADTAIALVEKYAGRGHVVFEGLLQSTYYGRMGLHSQQYGSRYIYAFLDTPVDLCIERVIKRREITQARNKFNPDLTKEKHETIAALKRKLEFQNQHTIVTLRHDGDLVKQLTDLL